MGSIAVDVTRLSQNGQVAIPKRIRDKLGLRAGDPLIACDVDGRIVLASARAETTRAEFKAIATQFDRRLTSEDCSLDAVELVRRLRDNKAQA